MNVRLAYGKTGLEIELPDDADVTVVEPTYVQGLPDQAGAVREALQQPIGSPPLNELVEPTDTVGIAFSDITRPTPNHLILPLLLDELAHVPADNVTLFNGTGTHRPNTEEELRQMLGDDIVDRYRIVQNDAADQASHELVGTTGYGAPSSRRLGTTGHGAPSSRRLGTTSHGAPSSRRLGTTGRVGAQGRNDIWLHRAFVACDARLLTGFIEPHFFAGFSGGGKAVMPGLALLETVMRNHSAEHLDSPQARWGIREGNPLWEEIHEAAGLIEPTFLLNVTLNRDQQITGVFAGDWEEAHAEGCGFVKRTAMVPVDAPFDIVITSNAGYPLDLNVYQAVKGMSAAAQVVREGGSIIIAADCWDGIPEHGDYGQLLHESDNIASLLRTVRDPDIDRQDTWQAHTQALISQKADVYFYSHNLTDQQIRDALLIPCRTVAGTVETLLNRYGPEATICVLPEGPQTVPYVRAG